MPSELEMRVEQAKSAAVEDLTALIHEQEEPILIALLENQNFQEKHAELLLDRLEISSAVISAVAGKGNWAASEGIRFRIARHPHAEKRLALAAARQLYLFDLVRLALLPSAPPDIRRIAEEVILNRIPHLPVGEKLTLARRGPSRVAAAIVAEGHPQAMKLALDNGFLTESQILKLLTAPIISERVVCAIAGHAKWSRAYNVRCALIRNSSTPANVVQSALQEITLRDLKDIGGMSELSPDRRGLIARELERRQGSEGNGR